MINIIDKSAYINYNVECMCMCMGMCITCYFLEIKRRKCDVF